MAKKIHIQFTTSGEGTLTAVGLGTFRCLGRPGFRYNEEVTVTTKDKFRIKKSEQYQVDMPWAILVHWKRGAFIHEMPATLETNGGPTAGCIHLDHGDAEKVWNFVSGPTRITTMMPW
ncbi:L,D-transpeptidase [Nannocystis radixulma]|uniref:L,D-transpeptidase n=1 Tax=Nannocystis radixulma TaxID=2995305 RepID=A0ABT5B3G2_9BACT|nr:L,D-transpeptidase [Nannocystis radixulma]MDC0668630.1 L,D-transpeptidase [Nannocystis radixulma]